MIMEIKKPRFEKLDFLVFPTTDVSAILKTMIFVDNIKTIGEIVIYLLSRLSPWLNKKGALFIQMFLVILIIEDF